MDIERFYSELKEQKIRREKEIVLLNNLLEIDYQQIQVKKIEQDEYKNSIKRSNICLMYAHIEGFVKFSFIHYITAINQLKLHCQDVIPILRAAMYFEDFLKLTNPDRKSQIFKKSFPFDAHLHRLYRQEEFFERITAHLSAKVEIKDKYINTESNVGREVLEKLLYQIGLPHNCLSAVTGTLSKLKNKRNDISHGTDMSIINDKDYEDYTKCTLDVMKRITEVILDAYQNQKYLCKEVQETE